MDSKLLALTAIILATTGSYMSLQSSQDSVSAFEAFKVKYGKEYTAQEEAYRLSVYMTNTVNINKHNEGNHSYTKGENQFTDMTEEEFASIYARAFKPAVQNVVETHSSESFVGDINWVTKGDVSSVKNQGQCGSCWTFSTVGSVESFAGIKTGTVGNFAEQQLVDCDRADGNDGCSGGWPHYALDYLAKAGICTGDSYPYTGVDGTCAESSCTKSSFTIGGHGTVSAGSTSSLKSACDNQPVSITINCGPWMSYKGGILTGCPPGSNHAVLLAGYTDAYWLVKNSWGATWGESGYIRLGPGDECGIADNAVYPTA